MKPLSDFNLFASPKSILLMGPPGGGKTTFALQWPDLWIADCDRNLAGPILWLRKKGIPTSAQRSEIQFDDDGKIVEVEAQWPRLLTETNKALESSTVKTLFLDSLTHIDRILYRYCCIKQNTPELEFQQWNMFKNSLYGYIMRVRDSGKNLIIACHEQIEYDKKGQVAKYTPTVSTNLKNYFAYMFTDAWRCVIEGQGGGVNEAMLYTQPTNVSELKSSLATVLPAKLPATYAAIESAIKKTQQ